MQGAILRKSHVSVAFNEFPTFDNITVRERLEFFAVAKGVREAVLDRHIRRYAEPLRLWHCMEKGTKQLTRSEKKLLYICMAMLGSSVVVLLENPTDELDDVARQNFWNVVYGL